MALDQLGLSFLPQGGGGQEEGNGEGSARLEDILQILSFRLPKILGARAIAPQELLSSQGGGDPLAQAIASAILSKQFQPGAGGGMPGKGPGMPGIPGGTNAGPAFPGPSAPPPGGAPQPSFPPPGPAPKPRIHPIPGTPPPSGVMDDVREQMMGQRRRF